MILGLLLLIVTDNYEFLKFHNSDVREAPMKMSICVKGLSSPLGEYMKHQIVSSTTYRGKPLQLSTTE